MSERVILADTLARRFRGLWGYRSMPENTALILKPCTQVHMFFMRFDIGAIFLDATGHVLAMQRLRPWQVSEKVKGARAVVETGPEALEWVRLGDVMSFE